MHCPGAQDCPLPRVPARAAERLLQGIADVAAAFLIAQANAGAHMVQVFDSWAGALSPADFEKWELPALRRIAETFKAACPNKPIVIMPKGAHHSLENPRFGERSASTKVIRLYIIDGRPDVNRAACSSAANSRTNQFSRLLLTG